MHPGPAEEVVAGKEGGGPARPVEPVSLLGRSLGEVLLGPVETGEGRTDPAPVDPAPEGGPLLRLRTPGGRVEADGRVLCENGRFLVPGGPQPA